MPVLAQVEEDICSEEAELVARTQEKLAAAEVRRASHGAQALPTCGSWHRHEKIELLDTRGAACY